MNIILRELRANLKSLIIWCVSMAALIGVGMVKYAGVQSAGQSANDLINQLPEAMRGLLGMNNLDITSVAGYYGVFYLYLLLLGGTHAVMLGATIISKEERDKTADFLLVKPVTRSRVVSAKLAAVLINLLVFNLTTLVSSVIFVGIYNRGEPINDQIVYLMLALFILQLIFASIGAVISGWVRKTRRAASLATTLFLTTFLLSTAVELYSKIDFLKYVTPFQYFPAYAVMQGSYDSIFLLLAGLIIIGSMVGTYLAFQKRDIYI
ncbi:MAG: ABC transporter permease subunit [Syntrophomonadaceae bacterium]|nr:ABC transporter permease subunit [Syntrophomonadaceae bacterium]